MSLQITPIDPREPAQLDAWYDVYARAEAFERPFASLWMREETRATLCQPVNAHERVAVVGVVEGTVVAAGLATYPLRDNLTSADLLVYVDPDHRRQGHGTAVLAALEDMSRERGRTLAEAMVDHAYDAGPEGEGDPGVEMLRAAGYRIGSSEVQRSLRLPVADELLQRLAAEAAPHHAAYTLHTWSGRCPDDLVDSYAALVGLLAVEAPTGELEVEAQDVDAERVRQGEAAAVAAGRTSFVAAATDAAGTVVAYTEMMVPSEDPGRMYQWGTLVHRDHRGHRLGTAVKVANLRAYQADPAGRSPRTLVTFNAEVNGPMIAVNEVLGFRPSARGAILQKHL